MTEDLNKLRELAEAATPGPWTVYNRNGHNAPDDDFLGWEFDQGPEEPDRGQFRGPDARFIAAFNPATALSLLSRLKATEERAERLEGALRRIADGLHDVRAPHRFSAAREIADAALKTEGA